MKYAIPLMIALAMPTTPAAAQFSGPGGTVPSPADYIGRQMEIDTMRQQEDSWQSPGPGNLPYQGYPTVQPSYPEPEPMPNSYGQQADRQQEEIDRQFRDEAEQQRLFDVEQQERDRASRESIDREFGQDR